MQLESNPHLTIKNNVITFGDALFLQQKDRAQHQFQLLMGEVTLKPKMVDTFQRNMAHNISIAKREGFDYKHIVFPCKPIVFREKFQSIGVELNPIFSDQHHHPQVLYPTNILPEDYFLEDSHLKASGTLKIIEQVLEEFGYSKLPKPLYGYHDVAGDLRKMLGGDCLEKKQFLKSLDGLPQNRVQHFSTASGLEGNTGHLYFFFNPYALHNVRLVLFGDSFFQRRFDIFKRIFSEVVYFRNPYILDDVVKVLEPDIVLTGNAERYLWHVPDCDSARPWFMNYISNRYDSKKIPESDIKAITALFSGKSSREYRNMFGEKLTDLPRDIEKLSMLSESDIKTNADISFIKGMADYYEKEHPGVAYYLMSLVKGLGN